MLSTTLEQNKRERNTQMDVHKEQVCRVLVMLSVHDEERACVGRDLMWSCGGAGGIELV